MPLDPHDLVTRVAERLRRDGTWSCPCITLQPLNTTLIDALSVVSYRNGPIRLIMTSWNIAKTILQEDREMALASETGHNPIRPFRLDCHNLPLGLIGRLHGAPIIASLGIGVWTPDYIIMSSEEDPQKVDYGGETSFMVVLAEKAPD